jgi:hypothetical protein
MIAFAYLIGYLLISTLPVSGHSAIAVHNVSPIAKSVSRKSSFCCSALMYYHLHFVLAGAGHCSMWSLVSRCWHSIHVS